MNRNQNHDQSRSCDALGACQRRLPACKGCTTSPLRLAPGVLEGYRVRALGTVAQRRELLRVARKVGACMLVLVALSMAAGYLSGMQP